MDDRKKRLPVMGTGLKLKYNDMMLFFDDLEDLERQKDFYDGNGAFYEEIPLLRESDALEETKRLRAEIENWKEGKFRVDRALTQALKDKMATQRKLDTVIKVLKESREYAEYLLQLDTDPNYDYPVDESEIEALRKHIDTITKITGGKK